MVIDNDGEVIMVMMMIMMMVMMVVLVVIMIVVTIMIIPHVVVVGRALVPMVLVVVGFQLLIHVNGL